MHISQTGSSLRVRAGVRPAGPDLSCTDQRLGEVEGMGLEQMGPFCRRTYRGQEEVGAWGYGQCSLGPGQGVDRVTVRCAPGHGQGVRLNEPYLN